MHKVLVLDDDALVLKMMHKALGLLGYEALVAETPQQALEAAREERFDAVILETYCHAGQGLDVLKKLRKEEPELRIIALTGGNCAVEGALTREEIMQHGADDVLHKPVEMNQLERSLGELLDLGGQSL